MNLLLALVAGWVGFLIGWTLAALFAHLRADELRIRNEIETTSQLIELALTYLDDDEDALRTQLQADYHRTHKQLRELDG